MVVDPSFFGSCLGRASTSCGRIRPAHICSRFEGKRVYLRKSLNIDRAIWIRSLQSKQLQSKQERYRALQFHGVRWWAFWNWNPRARKSNLVDEVNTAGSYWSFPEFVPMGLHLFYLLIIQIYSLKFFLFSLQLF